MKVKDKEGFIEILSIIIFIVGAVIGCYIGSLGDYNQQVIALLACWWIPWFIFAMTIPIIADSIDGWREIKLNPDGWLKAFAETTNNWH